MPAALRRAGTASLHNGALRTHPLHPGTLPLISCLLPHSRQLSVTVLTQDQPCLLQTCTLVHPSWCLAGEASACAHVQVRPW